MRTWMLALVLWGALAGSAWAQGERPVRIGVVEAAAAATISASVDASLLDAGQAVAHVAANAPVAVEFDHGAIAYTGPDGVRAIAKGPVRLHPEGADARVSVQNHLYRGELEVRSGAQSLTVVNELSMEDYLYGVVPAESMPSWPLESLKAQAVAARTYAVSNLGQFAALGYDLKATVASQAYGGVAVEKPSTTRAVDETRGEILTYQGSPIQAFYSDCTGGYTEACADAWGRPLPYLQAVPDFDQESPRYEWDWTAPPDKVQAAVLKLAPMLGELVDLQILDRSFTGRVKHARLVGTLGTQDVTGEKLRFAFGLRSTFFNVARQADGSLAFAGRGWGHGVGMSQWGAKGMADMGYTFDQILAHYYPDTTLVTWDPTRSASR